MLDLPESVAAIGRSFPIMKLLTRYLKETNSLTGLRIGWHCHLTWLTALAAEPILESGGQLFMSECNPATTELESVDYMRGRGAEISLGADACQAVLERRPQIISDTGFVLIARYLEHLQSRPAAQNFAQHASESEDSQAEFRAIGACEITTSGITHLRALEAVPLPVVNINDGRLKHRIENFHGVGGEFMGALEHLTGSRWNGRPATVVGYGRVGAGVAFYLKQAGALVTVVEKDPVLRLSAHYDGFEIGNLSRALTESELLVTATGAPGLLGRNEWLSARDGLYVFNVGHWSSEVSPELLYEMASSRRRLGEYLEEISLPGLDGESAKRVYLAAGGSPANVAVCVGVPEPTLIHLATEILSIEFLARHAGQKSDLSPGELPVPDAVERQASLLALEALALDGWV